MNDFFKLDGPFFKYGTLIADLFILSLLFAFCCIPIFTSGAALTALYYVTTRQVSNREGYVSRDFFRSFKQNFVKSTTYFAFFGICGFLLSANFVLYNYVARSSQIVLVFQVVLTAELIGIAIYLFPLLARFDMRFTQYFKNAFFFANKHISTTVTCVVAFGACFWLFTKSPILIIILPGVYAYFSSVMIMRVFRKYLPDMDRDVEDREYFDIIKDIGESVDPKEIKTSEENESEENSFEK